MHWTNVILIIFASIFFFVAVIFTVEHANVLSISEKPLNIHDKSTAKKYFYIAIVSIAFAIIFAISDALLREIRLTDYFFSPIPKLMAMSLVDIWFLSYIEPSKRKIEVIRRKNFRNASPRD